MKTFSTLLAVMAVGLLSLLSPAMADVYGVRPGDLLKIEVLEDPSLDRSVMVGPDGRISVPQGGTFKVSGQSVDG